MRTAIKQWYRRTTRLRRTHYDPDERTPRQYGRRTPPSGYDYARLPKLIADVLAFLFYALWILGIAMFLGACNFLPFCENL